MKLRFQPSPGQSPGPNYAEADQPAQAIPMIEGPFSPSCPSTDTDCGAIGGPGRSPGGFTLVEVLVTVVVIAMGCLAALWLQSAAMRGNSQSDHLTVAGFLAESEIERLKSLDFAAATKEAEDHETAPVVQNLNRWGEIQTDGSGVYTRTVRYFPKRPTSLSHQVEVEGAWHDNHGPHRLDYTAALTDFSLN